MNQQKLDWPGFQVMAAPLYAMSALLILVPFSELAAQIGWRVVPGQMAWRTGVVGVLSSMTATPTFGLILAIVTAYVCDHRRVLRVLAIFAALVTLLTIAVVGLFSLDALQLRNDLREDLQPGFVISIAKALINFSLTILTLAITTLAAFRAGWGRKAKPVATGESRVGGAERPLLFEGGR